MNKTKKIISIILCFVLVFMATTAGYANDQKTSVESSENTNSDFVETKDYRLTRYFDKDICLQTAVLFFESGNIYYYDLTKNKDIVNISDITESNLSNSEYTTKSNLTDYLKPVSEKKIVIIDPSKNYSFVASCDYYDDYNVHIKRWLYNEFSEEITTQQTGVFVISLSFALVALVIGIPTAITAAWLVATGLGVAGYLVEYFSGIVRVKQQFVQYKLIQTIPYAFYGYSATYNHENIRRLETVDYGNTPYYSTYINSYYISPGFHDYLLESIGLFN